MYKMDIIKTNNVRFHSERELISEDLIFNLDYLINANKIAFNNSDLPNYEEEKDLVMYYERLLNNKDMLILPKLKNQEIRTYQYELN